MELRGYVKSAVPKDELVTQLGSRPGSTEGNGHTSPEQESQAESLETTVLCKNRSSGNDAFYFKENSVTSTDPGTGARLRTGPGFWESSGDLGATGKPWRPVGWWWDRALSGPTHGRVGVRSALAGAAPLGATATHRRPRATRGTRLPATRAAATGGKEGRNDVQLAGSHLGCICPCLQKHFGKLGSQK